MKKNWKVKLITMLMVFVLTMVNILPTQNAVYATSSGGYVDDNLVTQESSSLWEKALTAFLVAGTLGLYGLIIGEIIYIIFVVVCNVKSIDKVLK